MNLCFSSATQQKAKIFRKVLNHLEYLIYYWTALESQDTLCTKVKNLKYYFHLSCALFSLRCFACFFHETMTAAEKAGGVELSLFTKPVGLWHGADWDHVFFLIPSSPCRKLQCALAERWRRVGTGACHNVVMALSRSEDVKTRDTRTCSRHLTPWGAPSCLHRTLLRSRLFIPHLPDS